MRWQQWDDEPELVGTVVDVDEDYDYLTVRYTSGDREMACRAPARNFTFLMGTT